MSSSPPLTTTISSSQPAPVPPRKSFGWQLLSQKPLADPTRSFAGKTVLVTGANSGLGFAAATKFASLRASRLILGVRNLEAGRAAQRAIQEASAAAAAAATGQNGGGSGCEIEVWQLDMASHASVAAFARRAREELDRLDVAVLNAGVYMVAREVSAQGWEQTLQVNALSTALLGVLLLPVLRRKPGALDGSPATLEFVASRRAEAVQLTVEQRREGVDTLEVLNDAGAGAASGYNASERYRVSKFLVMCVVKKLAALVDPAEVTVTAVCPGGVATNLSRGWTGWLAGVLKAVLNALFLRTPEYAARTLVSAASMGSEASGKLWYDDELHE
jgi:NAD(P)-dependent dehydrogenase (short-subunit alcohol dehydrogenase family)